MSGRDFVHTAEGNDGDLDARLALYQLLADAFTQAAADLRYLQQTEAEATYETQANAASTYETQSHAAATYLAIANAFTQAAADARYAPIGLTSIKTFDGGGTDNTDPDGRFTDRPSSDYKRIVIAELKNRAALGIPGSGTYAALLTTSVWSDASAGATVGQLAFAGDVVSWRSATIGSAWSAWTSLAKVGDSYTMSAADARFLNLASAALTGLLTMANTTVAQLFLNNARIVSKDSTGTQAGEFILVAGDNGTYITLAPGGVFNIRNSANAILAQVDASGNVKAHGDVTAFGI